MMLTRRVHMANRLVALDLTVVRARHWSSCLPRQDTKQAGLLILNSERQKPRVSAAAGALWV